MKKTFMMIATMVSASAMAQVGITNQELGSGTPGASRIENTVRWENNIYHAPQYMPGYPTAATIFPRVVEVECKRSANSVDCKGYNWSPALGRGEYLMVQPKIVEPVKPQVVEKIVPVPVTVIKEVPIKKGKE